MPFRQAFLHAPIGMAIADPNGRFLHVNPAFCRIVGYSQEELAEKGWLDLLHPGAEGGGQAFPLALEGIPSLEMETRYRHKSGRTVLVQWNISLVRDSQGNPVYQIGQITDINDRKRVEEKLKQYAAELESSNQDLQHFASVASHDLQEPLRMVRSYLELIERRYRGKLDAEVDEFIGYAVDGAGRMQALIRDLLTYSRIGTHGRSFTQVDCAVALNQAMRNLSVALEESGAVVTTDENLPVLMADDVQLIQLFQNLIGNAVKFRSAEPPRVHVACQTQEGRWMLSVSDNGIGIDPKFAERIFVLFQRLHSQAKYPGTGIGLALCKRIVERHGGRIWVEPRPGSGSELRFTMPMAGGAEAG